MIESVPALLPMSMTKAGTSFWMPEAYCFVPVVTNVVANAFGPIKNKWMKKQLGHVTNLGTYYHLIRIMDIPRKVLVKNTWVELTPEQIAFIEKEEARKEKEVKKISSSFVNVLHHFGFKKAATVEGGYGHDEHQWWAEIIIHGNQEPYVWIVGNNLRDSSFPGGWTYWEPQDLFRALAESVLKM